MTIEELYLKLENRLFNDPDTVKVELLLEAITDWPNNVESLDDFIELLQADLEVNNITQEIIKSKIDKLSPNVDSWKMESYTGLIKIIQTDSNNRSLNDYVSYLQDLVI